MGFIGSCESCWVSSFCWQSREWCTPGPAVRGFRILVIRVGRMSHLQERPLSFCATQPESDRVRRDKYSQVSCDADTSELWKTVVDVVQLQWARTNIITRNYHACVPPANLSEDLNHKKVTWNKRRLHLCTREAIGRLRNKIIFATSFTSRSRGTWGPLAPNFFFKIMQFSGPFEGKPYLSKFGLRVPWGQNSAGPPWP